jgi:hypothetical protein
MARHSTTVAATTLGAVLVLGLTGCVTGAGGGPTQTRDVDIDDVQSVRLATSGELVVRRGTTPSLTVTAGERTHDRLVSEVRDGVLVLDSSGSMFGSVGAIRYELVVSGLEKLVVSSSGDFSGVDVTGDALRVQIEGSGDVDLEGVDAEDVRLSVEGSGRIDLAGRSAAVSASIAGSGDLDLEDLVVQKAEVSIEGSGSIDLDVRQRLAVRIEGSGSVTYSGDPEVQQDVEGSGSVRRG